MIHLTKELLIHLFTFLGEYEYLYKIKQVCKEWNEVHHLSIIRWEGPPTTILTKRNKKEKIYNFLNHFAPLCPP